METIKRIFWWSHPFTSSVPWTLSYSELYVTLFTLSLSCLLPSDLTGTLTGFSTGLRASSRHTGSGVFLASSPERLRKEAGGRWWSALCHNKDVLFCWHTREAAGRQVNLPARSLVFSENQIFTSLWALCSLLSLFVFHLTQTLHVSFAPSEKPLPV